MKKWGRCCCVRGCFNSKAKNPNLRLFGLPNRSKEDKFEQWLEFTGRRNEIMSEMSKNPRRRNYVICSSHFEDSQFMNVNSKSKLIWCAVPTMYPASNSSSTNADTSRKHNTPLLIQGSLGENICDHQYSKQVKIANPMEDNEELNVKQEILEGGMPYQILEENISELSTTLSASVLMPIITSTYSRALPVSESLPGLPISPLNRPSVLVPLITSTCSKALTVLPKTSTTSPSMTMSLSISANSEVLPVPLIRPSLPLPETTSTKALPGLLIASTTNPRLILPTSIITTATYSKALPASSKPPPVFPVISKTVSIPLPTISKPVVSNSIQVENDKMKDKLKQLKMKLRSKTRMLNRARSDLKDSRLKIRTAKDRVGSIIKMSEEFLSEGQLRFFHSQLTQTNNSIQARRWEDTDFNNLAVSIFMQSRKIYKMLGKTFCLPSCRTVRKWISNKPNYEALRNRNIPEQQDNDNITPSELENEDTDVDFTL